MTVSEWADIYDFFCLLACFIFLLLSFPLLSVFCLYNKKIKRKTFLSKKLNAYVEISNLFFMNQLAMNNIKSIYKDLMYSSWNSTRCYVAAWMGGGVWGRMDTCIHMAESLCCSPEITAALLIGCTPIQNKKLKVWGWKWTFTFRIKKESMYLGV